MGHTQFQPNSLIPIRSIGKIDYISPSDVIFLEAANNYCFIHLKNGKRRVVSSCMKQFFSKINADNFLKVHRKYVVNVDHINSLDLTSATLSMNTGAKVNISRSNKKYVKNWLLHSYKLRKAQ